MVRNVKKVIRTDNFIFWNWEARRKVDPGDYSIMLGFDCYV